MQIMLLFVSKFHSLFLIDTNKNNILAEIKQALQEWWNDVKITKTKIGICLPSPRPNSLSGLQRLQMMCIYKVFGVTVLCECDETIVKCWVIPSCLQNIMFMCDE